VATGLKAEARTYSTMKEYFYAEGEDRPDLVKKYNALAELAEILGLKNIEEFEYLDDADIKRFAKEINRNREKLAKFVEYLENFEKIDVGKVAENFISDTDAIANTLSKTGMEEKARKSIAKFISELPENKQVNMLAKITEIDPGAQTVVKEVA